MFFNKKTADQFMVYKYGHNIIVALRLSALSFYTGFEIFKIYINGIEFFNTYFKQKNYLCPKKRFVWKDLWYPKI